MTKNYKSGRTIMLLLVASISSIVNAQQQDYSNHVKLDSIIYPDGRNDYKYDFKYDKTFGNQMGFVRHIKDSYYWNYDEYWGYSNQPWFEECNFESWTGNSYIELTSQSESKYYGPGRLFWGFTQDSDGKLTESVYEDFGEKVRRTFDGSGRPTCIVFEKNNLNISWLGDEEYDSLAFQYHDNGKISVRSGWRQNKTPDGYQSKGGSIYTYDSNGHLIHVYSTAWDNKPFEYGEHISKRTITREYEKTYYYDEDSNLTRCEERAKETLAPVDKEFLDSMTEYEQKLFYEDYNKYYNVWKDREPVEYTTNVARDANGRVILRETKGGFVEKLNYDNNGNVTSRYYLHPVSDGANAIGEVYSYDENNRLVSQTVNLVYDEKYVADCVYHFEYWYDESGNRMIKEDRKSMTTPEPSSAKQYDINGNLIEETATHDGHSYRYEYTYNAKNQMNGVSLFVDSKLMEKIEYDTMTPSFKAGGIIGIPFWDRHPNNYIYFPVYLHQASYSTNHLVYLFDQPYRVKSYKVYGGGMEHDVQLYYSKFIEEENAIEDVTADEDFRTEYYDMQGRKQSMPAPGINIMKKNGKTVKVLIKENGNHNKK